MAVQLTLTTDHPFDSQQLIYLHCVDMSEENFLPVKGFPCLEIDCVLAHFSFPSSLNIRRACLILWEEETEAKLRDLCSPALIEVTSYCRFTLENDDKATCILDFDVLQAASGISAPPKAKRKADIKGVDEFVDCTPWLDIDMCDCNCTNYEKGALVMCRKSGQQAQSEVPSAATEAESLSDTSSTAEGDIEQLSDGEMDSGSEEEEVLYTDTLILRGSTFHEECQKALKIARELLLSKNDVPVQLSFEPNNLKDRNAIIVEVKVAADSSWCKIGYISKERIPKFTAALRQKQIREIKMKSIKCQYIMSDHPKWTYIPTVTVTKKDKWLPIDNKYRYNDTL